MKQKTFFAKKNAEQTNYCYTLSLEIMILELLKKHYIHFLFVILLISLPISKASASIALVLLFADAVIAPLQETGHTSDEIWQKARHRRTAKDVQNTVSVAR